jgi:hypothetical protein
MTAVEIIDETAAWYENNPRADVPRQNNEKGTAGCRYFAPNGAMCAVGRCMDTENEIVKALPGSLDNEASIGRLLLENKLMSNMDKLLQEKYRGHDVTFWMDLQEFHDKGAYWQDGKLTVEGKEYLDSLREGYALT